MNEHPVERLSIDIMKFLQASKDMDTSVVLASLSIVLATISVEADIEEEKAVYAFRKSYGNAKRRFKRLYKAQGRTH